MKKRELDAKLSVVDAATQMKDDVEQRRAKLKALQTALRSRVAFSQNGEESTDPCLEVARIRR